MNKKTAITGIIISVILNVVFGGLLIGGGLLVLELPKIFDTVLSVAFALIGISLVLTTIPNLIGGIASFKQKKGKFDLVFSIITMVIGVTLAIYGVITALIAFGVRFGRIGLLNARQKAQPRSDRLWRDRGRDRVCSARKLQPLQHHRGR